MIITVAGLGALAVSSLESLRDTAEVEVSRARAELGTEVVGPGIRDTADQIAREIGFYISERVADADTWARSPALAQAAAAGVPLEDDLADASIDELEKAYAGGRLQLAPLPADPSSSFTELFFTDARGYTMASNLPTSDFVQSDEDWWQGAWERGIHISTVDFDESAGVYSVDISLRIDDADGRPVGVMKAVMDVARIQAITDRFASGSAGYDVTITDQRGLFLAETATDHADGRVLNEEVTRRTVDNPRLARASASSASTFTIDEEAVAGFAQVNSVISGDDDPSTVASTSTLKTAFDWDVVVEQPVDVAFAAVDGLDVIGAETTATTERFTAIIALVGATAALLAFALIWLVSRRLTRPIEQLSAAATEVAETTLPGLVERIETLEEGEELAELPAFDIHTGDEVEALAQAFSGVQATAARLASDQARLRRQNIAKTFVSLGRRNQNLLTSQLELLDKMERSEADTEALADLFLLDHLVTRMRRNAESLLVMAGEEVPRRFRRPVSVSEVLQAARAEMEDFDRVEVVRMDEAHVDGTVASAVAHLLAELLENAARFSPPSNAIQVEGRMKDDAFVLSILDHGIGMSEEDLATANARLADPVAFDRAPSAYLGLFVVGHLAQRHGIDVRLVPSPFDGIVARVAIPTALLVEPNDPVAPGEAHASARSEPFIGGSLARQEADGLAEALLESIAPDPASRVDVVPETTAVPAATGAAPPEEVTPSGFRRRRRGEEGAPSERRSEATSFAPRDPQAARQFLASFRQGVAQGRRAQDPAEQAAGDSNERDSEGAALR